jgi:AMMECR1 domain-containing protein
MREDTNLPEDLADALERIELEIDVMYDFCEITDRATSRLMWNLELGHDGAFITDGDSFSVRLPSEALQGGVETEEAFIERLEKNAHLTKGAWREPTGASDGSRP